MLHSTRKRNNGIWTNKPVYRDLPVGNLETRLVRVMPPLQQGFDCDSQARLSVGIGYLSAFFAFEQGIVGGMSFPNSTAVGTPFRGMPAINDVQMNVIVKAPLSEYVLEQGKGNPHDGPVEPLAFWLEFGKLLCGNFSVKAFGKLDYLADDLPKIGLHKVALCGFELFELLFGSNGLKDGSSSHNLLAPCPDVPAKIGLIKDFAFGRNDRHSEVFGVHINPKNVLLLWDLLVLGEISDNLAVWEQAVSPASPSVGDKRGIALEVPVLLDWDCNPFAGDYAKLNEEVGFCGECFAVAWDVEFDANGFSESAFLAPRFTNEGANDLNVEGGVFLAS